MNRKKFMDQLAEMAKDRHGIQIALVCKDTAVMEEYLGINPDAVVQIGVRSVNNAEFGIRLWLGNVVSDVNGYRSANVNVIAFDDMDNISALAYQRFSHLAKANGEIGITGSIILQRQLDENDITL